MKHIYGNLTRLTLMLWLAVAMALASVSAHAQIMPGQGKGWLTIASRTNAGDAIALGQSYASRFPTAAVFSSTNGYFAVTLGWMDTQEGYTLLNRLVSTGAVPPDTYFTAGQRYLNAIWSASGVPSSNRGAFLRATLINRAPPPPPPSDVSDVAPRSAIVAGLRSSGDNYLSLRSGPSTRNPEIARMLEGTRVTITGTSGNWRLVTLGNGMRGWASGKYLRDFEVPVIKPDPVISKPVIDVPVIEPRETETASDNADTSPQPGETAQKGETDIAANAADQDGTAPAPVKPVGDQKRVALVVGNSDYANTVKLPNPRNDATALKAKLEGLGFKVVESLDSGKQGFETAVREFIRELDGADVALFFYAGHAMQVNGRNHLVPIDAKLEDSTAIDFETVDLGVILNFMNAEGRISIALIDACRDNPLSRRFQRVLGPSRSAFIGRGLAAPATGAGEVLIGFATAPGEVALDGDGDNSPFTTALLKHIDAVDLDVELMLKRVRQDVYDLTKKEQEPWVNSALRREFKFNPG